MSFLPLTGGASALTPDDSEHKASARSQRDKLPFGVFGSLEFATNAAKGLGEWKRVTAKLDAERAVYAGCDKGAKACPENLRQWRAILKSWSSLGQLAKLTAVNSYVNGRIRYSDDATLYGRADFWASPGQALGGRGDCEDYVIAKYESLRTLGFSEDDLRIVVLKDLRRGIGHAVLSVRTASGLYVLDNLKARPFLHDSVDYYAPVFSINREGRWINIATRKIRAQYAIAAEERGDPALARPAKARKTVRVARIGLADVETEEGAGVEAAAAAVMPEMGAPVMHSARLIPRLQAPKKNAQPVGWARELP
ncbi:MAG: transglutaminase-like cysteine peptidase [Pseudomonadota bacterium]